MAVSRNDPCPCGSGKKYKKCCLGNPDPKSARHSKTLKILFAVLTVVTVAAFLLAGRGVGSAVGLASFSLVVGYLLIGPSPASDGGAGPQSGPPI